MNFQDPEIIAGVPSLSVFPDESTRNDKIFHYFFNNIFRISFSIKSPVCGGQCQIVKADSFWEVGGYDGYIVHSEDSDLFRRLSKTGKLHFFSDLVVYESPRRYRYYGYIKLLLKGVYSYIYQLIFKKNFFDEWRKIEYN